MCEKVVVVVVAAIMTWIEVVMPVMVCMRAYASVI